MAKKEKIELVGLSKKYYKVKIELLDDMLGTLPKNKNIYTTYIESKSPHEIKNEVDDIVEMEEKGWTGFLEDPEKGLYISNHMVLGFLKEAGNVNKAQFNVSALRDKIGRNVFVGPRKIFVGKMKPDGVNERPLRGMTAQGPITSIARSDYIKAGTVIDFHLIVMENEGINGDMLKILLRDYGCLKGLGQNRNSSYGRFELLEFEETEEKLRI
jgi:hypothetical protein